MMRKGLRKTALDVLILDENSPEPVIYLIRESMCAFYIVCEKLTAER